MLLRIFVKEMSTISKFMFFMLILSQNSPHEFISLVENGSRGEPRHLMSHESKSNSRNRTNQGGRKGGQGPPIFGIKKTGLFSTNTQSRSVSIVLDGVLGP